MMKDIDYFSKEKLSKVRLLYSRFEAPPEPKAIFLSLFPYNVCTGFLQDYKKSTADGLDEVKFWYGSTKFILVMSPALFGITRGVDKATGMSAWKHVYFDSLTGKCLASKRSEAAEKLNQIGLSHLDQNEFSLALHYFEMAAKNTIKKHPEQASLFTTNLAQAYLKSRCYRKAIAKAEMAIMLSGNVQNHEANEIKTNAETKLEAYQHYVKGREIWVQAWQDFHVQSEDYASGREAQKKLRCLEAKFEFEQACKLDCFNQEFQSALEVAQRAEDLDFRQQDLQLADASEIFTLGTNFKDIDELKLAEEKFNETEQAFKSIDSKSKKISSEAEERRQEIIQEYQSDLQKHRIYLDVKSKMGSDSSAKTDIKKLQTIESFEYDRSYFGLLCRLKNLMVLAKNPNSDLLYMNLD